MPREPTFQTLHVAAVSFNSLLLGEIVVPDWDMFQVSCPISHFLIFNIHWESNTVTICIYIIMYSSFLYLDWDFFVNLYISNSIVNNILESILQNTENVILEQWFEKVVLKRFVILFSLQLILMRWVGETGVLDDIILNLSSQIDLNFCVNLWFNTSNWKIAMGKFSEAIISKMFHFF